jgi:T4 RnlA family RNA ligase
LLKLSGKILSNKAKTTLLVLYYISVEFLLFGGLLMFNTELGIFCSAHDNWEELLAQEPYFLKIKEDGRYVIFNYDQIRSDFSIPLVQEARGIIFDKDDWSHPVCWAFNKFFNYGEPTAAEINWDTVFVTEKIDGSLMKVWWDGDWHISTNGTINAFDAKLNDVKVHDFEELFLEALGKYYNCFGAFTDRLDHDLTYMFELVSPYNRVVIPYEESDIYFLGARDKYTGEEFNCSSLNAGALGMGRFKRPKQYPLTSVNDCIDLAETFGWDQEGFVACDAEFNRVKIKSPAYVMAHYARNNNVITRKHLIKVILDGEAEEFLCYAADYKEELEKVQNLMNSFCKVGDQIAKSCQRLYDVPRGTFANWVKTLPRIYQDLAFRNYNDIKSTKDYTSGWNENKWDTYLEEFEEFKQQYFN